MNRTARLVIKNRLWVIAAWIVLLVAGGATASATTDRLTFDFSTPGEPGYETAEQVMRTYQTDAADAPFLLVLTAPGDQRLDEAAAAATFNAVQTAVPETRIVDKYAANGDPNFSTADGRSQFAYAFGAPGQGFEYGHREPLLRALQANAPPGASAQITGINELTAGNGDGEAPAVWVETVIAALGALAVLAFVFGSLLAFVPLIVGAVAIMSTFLVLLGVTYVIDVSFIVQYLVALVGLGVAIDYSLLVVTRWREERSAGLDNDEAVVRATETAGHAVVFSGLTVAVGLLALVALPVPFLRSIGIGGLLIPLVSVAVVVTLLPALLSWVGPRVDWPKMRNESHQSPFWTRWGTAITRHPRIAAVAGVLVLAALIVPVTSTSLGNARADSLASSGPAVQAWEELRNGGVPAGALTPLEVLSDRSAAARVVQGTRDLDGVTSAFVVTGDEGLRGEQAISMVVPDEETVDAKSLETVRTVRNAAMAIPGVVGVAGLGPVQLDYMESVYGNAPLALGLIMLITYVLLVRAFRSLLLPLKAVILNVLSLAATFGAITLFWQQGYGSSAIFGIEATGAITFWLPVLVFAFLYGLSMDYEVFILARMREEWDAKHDTTSAVILGTARTGRLVTSAALILFLAFLSLTSTPQTDIKVLATALGFGILLDATVVRMLLVPALVSLFGRYNWYLPELVAQLLRVKPSPLTPAAGPVRPAKRSTEAEPA